MEIEFAKWLLSTVGGGLAATWGMLRLTNGRIRKLEIDRVTPADCQRNVATIRAAHVEMWSDIKRIAEAVARIEGRLGERP